VNLPQPRVNPCSVHIPRKYVLRGVHAENTSFGCWTETLKNDQHAGAMEESIGEMGKWKSFSQAGSSRL